MAQFGPAFGDLLVITYSCRGDGDALLEKGTIEDSHGTIDGRAKHGRLGGFTHGFSVVLNSLQGGIMVLDTR